jgi:hypothetical protein
LSIGAGPDRSEHEVEMKTYLLSIYQPDGPPPPPDVLGPIMARVGDLQAELRAAGAGGYAAALHPPSTATTVRVRVDDVLLTDGPFTEGKEHIGGFTIVRAPDLDAALAWARKLSAATTLPIEVRPIVEAS